MKNLVILILPLLFLTSCMNDKEVAVMMEELSAKKVEAVKVIEEEKWELESLLVVHDYFFNFAERIHLLKEEPKALETLQKFIKKKGAKVFCESFVLPLSQWQALENYCDSGDFYRCSPEIKEYLHLRQTLFGSLKTACD